MTKLPLEGIRVIDCSHIVAGPFTSMLLAQAGAQVIKLEPPATGERLRRGASIPNAIGERAPLNFIALNRGKLGITLNLRDPQGKEAFKKLVAVSDVLVENYRPGALKELGLSYDVLKAVNPRLIYASISGFGKRADLRGPYSGWTAHNPSAQAMSGLMDGSRLPGGPPMQVGAPIGDTIPALWTAYGITLALRQREQTGTGQFLDIAMYDTMSMHNYGAVAAAGVSSSGTERRHQELGPSHRLSAACGTRHVRGVRAPGPDIPSAGRPDQTIGCAVRVGPATAAVGRAQRVCFWRDRRIQPGSDPGDEGETRAVVLANPACVRQYDAIC